MHYQVSASIHPSILMLANMEALHFTFIQYRIPKSRRSRTYPETCFTWLSNRMLILHNIGWQCHVSPEKEVSCSPWDASNQETACWLQCFEPSICLEDSSASFMIWLWNPPHRLLGSILGLSWKMLLGRFWNLWRVRFTWRKYITEDMCFVPDLSLPYPLTGWAASIDVLVTTFCLILGPELMELRTMHWDIWNCELRKLLLPLSFFFLLREFGTGT